MYSESDRISVLNRNKHLLRSCMFFLLKRLPARRNSKWLLSFNISVSELFVPSKYHVCKFYNPCQQDCIIWIIRKVNFTYPVDLSEETFLFELRKEFIKIKNNKKNQHSVVTFPRKILNIFYLPIKPDVYDSDCEARMLLKIMQNFVLINRNVSHITYP